MGLAKSEATRIIRILIQYHDRPAGNLWRGTEVDITARTRNPLGAQAPRGFESHLLRHTVKPGDVPVIPHVIQIVNLLSQVAS